MVSLSEYHPEEDAEAAKRFHETTGWQLAFSGKNDSDSFPTGFSLHGSGSGGEDFFFPSDSAVEAAEQNRAFSRIDEVFENLPHKPDKKSIKQDAEGKYMEICFITPEVGRRYPQYLQSLADETGMRIRIGDKVNQNEMTKIALLLCMKYEIPLGKNPSYLPAHKTLQLRTAEAGQSEIRRRAAEEFQEMTGCTCIFIDP